VKGLAPLRDKSKKKLAKKKMAEGQLQLLKQKGKKK
jgi:hypothetical protein